MLCQQPVDLPGSVLPQLSGDTQDKGAKEQSKEGPPDTGGGGNILSLLRPGVLQSDNGVTIVGL